MIEIFNNFNKSGLSYLNSFSENEIVKKIVGIFADLPIFLIPAFLLFAWLYYNYKKNPNEKNDLLFIFYSTIIGIIATLIIQHFIQFDRPENYIKNSGNLLLSHIPDASFPSDHATVGASFLFSLLFAGYKKTFMLFLPFFVIMFLSRIIAGVHWPLDIIVGIIIGFIASFITFKFLKRFYFIKKLNTFLIKIASFFKL